MDKEINLIKYFLKRKPKNQNKERVYQLVNKREYI